MLFLQRHHGEKINIGDDIEIVIKFYYQGQAGVFIGIDAPKDVPVWRNEVYERIKSGNDKKPAQSSSVLSRKRSLKR